MAQYAILLYEPAPGDPETLPEAEIAAQMRFGDQIGEHGGTAKGGMALMASTTSTTIRGDVVTDGPFIESKEVLAGLFVLEARDLDHALEIAKLCPTTRTGAVEVRPLFDYQP